MNDPYGKKQLVNSVVDSIKEKKDLLKKAKTLKQLRVEDRFISDCEMLAIGAFTPIDGFMVKDDVDSVVNNMTTKSGLIWGIPVVLMASSDNTSGVNTGDEIALIDADNNIIAIMAVNDKFRYPKNIFCKEIYKTEDSNHPGVRTVCESPDVFLGGPIKLLNRPKRDGINPSYYMDPQHTRDEFKKRGWSTIVAFQTRNPIHRAHEFLIKCSLESVDGVFIHPLVGETKSDDIPASVRMECYEVLLKDYFNQKRVLLSVLPTFMRYAGPREAINHAIIRKNYGCTHFIIGRDHAGVGNYYGTYDAQNLLSAHAERIGITPIKFENSFFCKKCGTMATQKTCPHTPEYHLQLSGTKVREMLKDGIHPPVEFSRKEVIDILIEWAKGLNKLEK